MNDKDREKLFGEIGVDLGFFTTFDVADALNQQKVDEAIGQKKPIGGYLFEAGKVNKEQISKIIAMQEKILGGGIPSASTENEGQNRQEEIPGPAFARFQESLNNPDSVFLYGLIAGFAMFLAVRFLPFLSSKGQSIYLYQAVAWPWTVIACYLGSFAGVAAFFLRHPRFLWAGGGLGVAGIINASWILSDGKALLPPNVAIGFYLLILGPAAQLFLAFKANQCGVSIKEGEETPTQAFLGKLELALSDQPFVCRMGGLASVLILVGLWLFPTFAINDKDFFISLGTANRTEFAAFNLMALWGLFYAYRGTPDGFLFPGSLSILSLISYSYSLYGSDFLYFGFLDKGFFFLLVGASTQIFLGWWSNTTFWPTLKNLLRAVSNPKKSPTLDETDEPLEVPANSNNASNTSGVRIYRRNPSSESGNGQPDPPEKKE